MLLRAARAHRPKVRACCAGVATTAPATRRIHRLVGFVDLTLPSLALERDWVVSLEVGEHIPREHEYTFLRNLHAHNCVGVLGLLRQPPASMYLMNG